MIEFEYFWHFSVVRATVSASKFHLRPMYEDEEEKGRSLDFSHGMPRASDKVSMSSKL